MTTSIPLEKLYLTKVNPRVVQTTKHENDALIASIKAHGLLYPLLVRTLNGDGKHEILDGGRRFTALKAIGDYEAVDCEILDLPEGQYPDEIGLAANSARSSMHPIDEAAVIGRMSEAGTPPGEIAVRFGKSLLWVKQRVLLGTLDKNLQEAVRRDQLDLEAAMACTRLSAKGQKSLGTDLKAHPKRELNAWQVTKLVLEEMPRRKLSEALFDIAHYPSEKIEHDLFGRDGESVWLLDGAEFARRQKEAIDAWIAEHKAQGWEDVTFQYDGRFNTPKGWERVYDKVKVSDRSSYVLMGFHEIDSNGLGRFGSIPLKPVRKTKAKTKPGQAPTADEALDASDLSQGQSVILNHELSWLAQQGLLDSPDHALWFLVVCALGRSPTGQAWRTDYIHYDKAPGVEARVEFDEIRTLLPYEAWARAGAADRKKLYCAAAARRLELLKPETAGAFPLEWYKSWRPSVEFLKRYTREQLKLYARMVWGDNRHDELIDKGSKTDAVAALAELAGKEKKLSFLPVELSCRTQTADDVGGAPSDDVPADEEDGQDGGEG